jgi:hypothetical protein
MIIAILSIFYAFYFGFLNFHLSDSKVEFGKKPLPGGNFIVVAIPFGLIIWFGVFWGFMGNPYGDVFSIPDEGMQFFFFLLPMSAALVFSYCVMYRIGKIHGIAAMENTAGFQ